MSLNTLGYHLSLLKTNTDIPVELKVLYNDYEINMDVILEEGKFKVPTIGRTCQTGRQNSNSPKEEREDICGTLQSYIENYIDLMFNQNRTHDEITSQTGMTLHSLVV